MNNKTAKIIAIVIAVAMLLSAFSMVVFIPGMLGSTVVYGAEIPSPDLDKRTKDLKDYILYIEKNYKDAVSRDKLMDGAFKGVTDSLADKYSDFYSTKEGEAAFKNTFDTVLEGIGAVCYIENGKLTIDSTVLSSPAQKAGIQQGDVITRVNGINISKMTLEQSISLIKGPAGTEVTIELIRKNKTMTYKIVRAKVGGISVSHAFAKENNKIGYIQINTFDSDTAVEFANAKMTLINKGAEALIIDIRDNPGGYVDSALEIANQLINKGALIHYQQQGKIVQTINATGNTVYPMPIAVIMNEGTASAAEILAAALKENGAATLVGSTTYGKGVVQMVVPVGGNSSGKFSGYYWLTPSKNSIDGKGITPDIKISLSLGIADEALEEAYNGFVPMSEMTKPKQGDIGLNVYGAQQRLDLLGYKVTATGTMDKDTTEAIQRFQKSQNLWASGSLDFSTRDALEKSAANFARGESTEDTQAKAAIEYIEKQLTTKKN